MKEFGFVKVGSIVNKMFLGDPKSNADEIIRMIKEAVKKEVSIVSLPQLALTGYTCGDLFYQDKLIEGAMDALKNILDETNKLNIISVIGMPIKYNNNLYNCAVVVNKGNILGIVPKNNINNTSIEKRYFKDGNINTTINLLGQEVLFSNNLLFRDKTNKNITFDIVFGNLIEKNSFANIVFNLDSSFEIVGREKYRNDFIKMESINNVCGYVYSSSGMMESSSDMIFSGDSYIYENGELLSKGNRFSLESTLIYNDIDVDKLSNLKLRNNETTYDVRKVLVDVIDSKKFNRNYKEYPFVPGDISEREERCNEIINIQANALVRRLIQLNYPKCVLGISGGLDSTLAFLVVVKAYEILGIDNKNIIGVTMPGFGTTGRTYKNACSLVEKFGATLKEVSIRDAAILHMKDIGLDENDRSVAYENLQARERTQILMDIANMENGFVIGTGDLSEAALGWCTYNGDHMSMYSVNCDIPKTLVRYLVDYFADISSDDKKDILKDILDTPISPELLPPDKAGNILQQTESSIGPYVLHDFFLYHFIRYGASPKKIYFLARETFEGKFTDNDLKKWLKVFMRRFFTQQFKRNCVPDGIKVGSIGLSPRGDFVMMSDVSYKLWMDEVDNL